MTRQATLTSGITFWVSEAMRYQIDKEAADRGVSVGTVARELLYRGRGRMRPHRMRVIPPGEVQISFMITKADRYALDAFRDEHNLTLSQAARLHLRVGMADRGPA